MKDILIFCGVFAGWIALNMWVLPFFGIRTCMSGACRVPEVKQKVPHTTADMPTRNSQTIPQGDSR